MLSVERVLGIKKPPSDQEGRRSGCFPFIAGPATSLVRGTTLRGSQVGVGRHPTLDAGAIFIDEGDCRQAPAVPCCPQEIGSSDMAVKTQVLLRAARFQDAEATSQVIADALRQTNATDYSPDVIARMTSSYSAVRVGLMIRGREMFVAEVDDGIVGVIGYSAG